MPMKKPLLPVVKTMRPESADELNIGLVIAIVKPVEWLRSRLCGKGENETVTGERSPFTGRNETALVETDSVVTGTCS